MRPIRPDLQDPILTRPGILLIRCTPPGLFPRPRGRQCVASCDRPKSRRRPKVPD
ncbi:MAG: hypothetical protein WC093_03430 [Methanoculleus sp.]